MKKILPFFLFLILLVGCASNEPYIAPKPKPIPSWYLNPPKGSSNFAYVTGSAINKKEAILNALSNFISRYSVTISSNFQTKAQDFGGGLTSKNSVNNIKATVKQFEVSNYNIEKVEQYSFDKVFVLVKVDINKLYVNVKNQLDNRFKEYKNEYYITSRENLLNQFIDLKKLYYKVKEEKNYISILKTMNDNFNEKQYLSFINKIKRKLFSLKKNLCISVVSQNRIIAEEIKKYLTNEGIHIGKSNILIEAIVKRRTSSSYNMRLITYQIYTNLKYKNTILGSNQFKFVVPSSANINGYLFNNIKDLSIEKFLSLK